MANPNNYIGATVTVVGYAAGEVKNPAYDKDGTRNIKQLSIPVNEGYKKDGEFIQTGTTWYTVEAFGDSADELVDMSIGKGDKVRVEDARQEVREYTNKDGETKLGITLKFGKITVLERSGKDEPAF